MKSYGYINDNIIDKLALLFLLWLKTNDLLDEEIDKWSVLSQEVEPGENIFDSVKIMLRHGLSYETISEYFSLTGYRDHFMWKPLLAQVISADDIKTKLDMQDKFDSWKLDMENKLDGWKLRDGVWFYEKPTDENYKIEDTEGMTADMFEKLIAAIYNKQGYYAKQTQFTGDQGVDVLASKGNTTIAIQAKCYRHPVGNSAVQEVVAGKALYGATDAIVITNSTFTSSARKLAEANGVALCDREMLKMLMFSFPVTYEDLIR